MKRQKNSRKHEQAVRTMYEQDEVTRTKPANAAVMRVARLIRPTYKKLLRQGWKKWQVEQIMREAIQHEACFINLLWNRPEH